MPVCSVLAAWNRGKILAEGQNLARSLMEAPANVMTPTRFAEIASEKLGPLDNITVRARCDTLKFSLCMSVMCLHIQYGIKATLKYIYSILALATTVTAVYVPSFAS